MQTEEHNDKDWLDALAGRTPEGADPANLAQALAVRNALTKRRAAIEADAAQPDLEQFERLRQRLQQEGLLSQAKASNPATPWQRFLGGRGLGGGAGASGVLVGTRWVALAVAVVGVLFALRLATQGPEQGLPADVLRGGETTVIVPDAHAKLNELQAGLLAAKAVFSVKELPDGRILLEMEASDPVLNYLAERDLFPTKKDGKVRLLIEKQKTP